MLLWLCRYQVASRVAIYVIRFKSSDSKTADLSSLLYFSIQNCSTFSEKRIETAKIPHKESKTK